MTHTEKARMNEEKGEVGGDGLRRKRETEGREFSGGPVVGA